MSSEKKRALGRGLDALLPTVSTISSSSGASYGDRSVFTCPIETLHPQQGQPRQRMDGSKLDELAAAKVYEFAFVMQPLKGAMTGSTVAPVAIR